MRRLASAARRPVLALPVQQVRGSLAHALPPHVTVISQRDIRENHVLAQRGHCILVRLLASAWSDAKKSGLGIDRAQAPITGALIHAMSSPIVVTFQPLSACGGMSIAKLVLPQADGNAAAT